MPFAVLIVALAAAAILTVGCSEQEESATVSERSVPHEQRWGIYALDIATQHVELLLSSSELISYLHLNHHGDKFAFSTKMDGTTDEHEEICIVGVNGTGLTRLTNNGFWDLYPSWSPGDSQIAFLSFRDSTLDIYVMEADGDSVREVYDSGYHDADIDWGNERIAFTRNSQVWSIKADGTDAARIADPPRAGEWGQANLPFGDYDPRWSPDGSKLLF